jgi:putative SOS response-associated peptidase YedK
MNADDRDGLRSVVSWPDHSDGMMQTMCGRLVVNLSERDMERYFQFRFTGRLAPSFNLAPTRDVPCILGTDHVELAHWGLIPKHAADTKFAPFNAKAETLARTFPFKAPLQAGQTCLIPATAFYEWQKQENSTRKQPWAVGVKDGPMALAGLWERHEPTGRLSCTIITTQSNDLIKPLHHRMPVILAPEDWPGWLQRADVSLLRPYPADHMWAHRVRPLVGNARNQGPECLEPLPADTPPEAPPKRSAPVQRGLFD